MCFNEAEHTTKAIIDRQDKEEFTAFKYSLDGKPTLNKVSNNLFVKNLPLDVTDDEMRALFSPYGNITSLYKGISQ